MREKEKKRDWTGEGRIEQGLGEEGIKKRKGGEEEKRLDGRGWVREGRGRREKQDNRRK